MVGAPGNNAAERTWKHRFAQTLYDYFCEKGVDRAAALDDAYAHADAQYLVRGLASPEDQARSALTWITAHKLEAERRRDEARRDASAHKPTNSNDDVHHTDGASGAD